MTLSQTTASCTPLCTGRKTEAVLVIGSQERGGRPEVAVWGGGMCHGADTALPCGNSLAVHRCRRFCAVS